MHLPKIKFHRADPSFRVAWLRQNKYNPMAVINSAALLGWTPFGSGIEVEASQPDDTFSMEDLVSYVLRC